MTQNHRREGPDTVRIKLSTHGSKSSWIFLGAVPLICHKVTYTPRYLHRSDSSSSWVVEIQGENSEPKESQICRMLSGRGSRPYWGVLLPLPAAPPPPSSTAFYISAVFFMSDLYNTDCLCTLICTILSAYFYCILPAGCLLLLSCAMLTVFFFCILHSTILVTFLYCISLTDRPLLRYCACCAVLFSYSAFSEALSAFYYSSSIAKQLPILR